MAGKHRAAPTVTVEPRSSFGEEYWAVLVDGDQKIATFDRDSRDPSHSGKAEADEFARREQERIHSFSRYSRRAATAPIPDPGARSRRPSNL